ncbi:MAG TPA: heavy-metal-associated domain-containing protein [Bacteroidia bacterium]
MKNIVLICFLAIFSNGLFAQSTNAKPKKEVKTIEFQVRGNCDQCKKRIENAAYIKGVKSTYWDEEKQILKVTYRADKVTEQEIHQAVAKSGHQTNLVEVDKTAYQELPECCKYQDKDCTKKK